MIAFSASQAFAAPKYTKKESDIQATQSAATKPTQHKADDKTRPTISAEDVFGGVGEQLKGISDQQISVLKRLIDATNDSDPEKPDLYFRMAELYAEEQRYYNFRSRELDQKIFDAQTANRGGEVANLKTKQADYQNKEKQWTIHAVQQFIFVADNPKFANYKRMDEVLFSLAYLLTEVKKEDAALRYFKRLIKDYPTSKFIPDANLAFGEYFFEQKELDKALQHYERVLKFPQSRVYGYARYKEGWVYYNIQDFKKALEVFVDVITMSEKGQGSALKQNRLALAKEAKKDLVRTYARVGTPDKAWPFFQRYGGDYAMVMEEQLAELYNGQGQFIDSIKVFRSLIAIAPTSPKLCAWETEIVNNTLSATGSRANADSVKEMQRLAAVYEKTKEMQGLKGDVLEECRDSTASKLRELATIWHKECQKTNNQDTCSLAQYIYKEYIKTFPKEKDSYTMNFYYAELLFTLGQKFDDKQKFCDAGPAYTDVIKMDPSDKAKYRNEAAYAAVISWKNCLDIDDSREEAQQARQRQIAQGKQKGTSPADAFAEHPIPDRYKKMLEAFDTYIKYVNDSKELPSIKYRKARVYYEYNHFDEAAPLFKDLVDHHVTSELAIYAANLYLDCLAIGKKFDVLETTIDDFGKNKVLMADAEFAHTVDGLKCRIIRKHIEQVEKEKDYRGAASMYMRLAEQCPNDNKMDEVYFNAAVNFERAKLIGPAIRVREDLFKRFPDSALAKKAVYLIGRNYQDIAAFDLAADKFETFASKYPGEKDASTALYTASFFRRGLGDNDKAIEDTSQFTKTYGARKEFTDKAAGVAFEEGQIYEQQKDYGKLQKHLADYIKNWGARGGVDREIIAHVKLGELLWKQSCPLGDKTVNGACIEVSRTRSGGAERVAQSEKSEKGKKKHHKKGSDVPKQCGPDTKSKITVHTRKPELVKQALAHFDAALKLFKGGAITVPGKDEAEKAGRLSAAAYHAAEAKMLMGDLDYEKFLATTIPDKLDFSEAPEGSSPGKTKAAKARVEDSKKKFLAYITNKTAQLEKARAIYVAVILYKQAHWAIAASARVGQLYQDFSGQLYTAPVPKAPPGIDEQYFHDAYCDGIGEKADSIEAKAIDGLDKCLSKSAELSWFNEWSALCESELNQLQPSKFPLASEIRAQPGYVQIVLDRAPVQSLENK